MRPTRALLFLLLALPAAAEPGRIRVACEPHCWVWIDGKYRGVTTAEAGGFVVESVGPGKVRLKVSRPGAQAVVRDVEVGEGATVDFRVEAFVPPARISQGPLENLEAGDPATGVLIIRTIPEECTIDSPYLDVIGAAKSSPAWTVTGLQEGTYAVTFAAAGNVTTVPLAVKKGRATCYTVDIPAGTATPAADSDLAWLVPTKLAEPCADQCWVVRFSPDGKRLAAGGDKGQLLLFDTDTWKASKLENRSVSVYSIAFRADGQCFAVGGSSGLVEIFHTETSRLLVTCGPLGHSLNELAFRPDGLRVAGVAANGTVVVWNAVTGNESARVLQNSTQGHDLAWDPKGDWLAVAAEGEFSAFLWNPASREIRTLDGAAGHEFGSLAFSPDGKTLAAGRDTGQLVLFDAESGKERCTLGKWTTTFGGSPFYPRSVEFTPDGRTVLAAGFDAPEFKAWDPATGIELRTFAPLEGDRRRPHLRAPDKTLGRCLTLSVSPDGKRLAAGYSNGAVIIWAKPTAK